MSEYTGRWIALRTGPEIRGTRPWVVRRDLGVVVFPRDYIVNKAGKLRRWASKEAAQRVADEANGAEGGYSL